MNLKRGNEACDNNMKIKSTLLTDSHYLTTNSNHGIFWHINQIIATAYTFALIYINTCNSVSNS